MKSSETDYWRSVPLLLREKGLGDEVDLSAAELRL